MPWSLNVNCPFSCFGCFRGHSSPRPFTLHLPALTTLIGVFGQSDTVEGGPQRFWLSALSLAFHCSPLWHSYPTLNIILNFFGIGSVYFGIAYHERCGLTCAAAMSVISSPSISILRRSQTHLQRCVSLEMLIYDHWWQLLLFSFFFFIGSPIPLPPETQNLRNIFLSFSAFSSLNAEISLKSSKGL